MKTIKDKYRYPEPVPIKNRRWPDNAIKNEPVWCSVDLRDGNQALPVPMNPIQKMEYFDMLVRVGFQDVEVGFPSASKDDFDFTRAVVEREDLPPATRVSVLTQARRHLIERTVESLKGTRNGLLHCYVATSDLHGRVVFNSDRAKVKAMAVEGTKIVADLLAKEGMRDAVGYEFSPEEFTDSDLDFVVELCAAVKEAWGASSKNDFILNLPATVERRPPYQYADMIELFIEKYPYMDETTISVHAHNDQGCAVAATEMTLLAGADRVEGTIFGHGERTGNLDVVTLALNIYSRGVDVGLDFSDLPAIVRLVEETSKIPVHPRHPYAGQFVFTAFSGSHQDAIRKGIERKEKAREIFKQGWKVPYLHVDPADVGRQYEKLIRINSQSGKGGVAYVLEFEYGICPPKAMHPEIGLAVQREADSKGGEIGSERLYEIFRREFVETDGPFNYRRLSQIRNVPGEDDSLQVDVQFDHDGVKKELRGVGNGPISAVVHALKENKEIFDFVLEDFSEQTLGKSADASAMAFIGIRRQSDNRLFYGAGEHSNIDQAALRALFNALNRASTMA